MKKFTHRNESFQCIHCGKMVPPSSRTCRNHCPFCLHSLHLDVLPGDRSADCGGVMVPVQVEYHSKKGYQIVHRCEKCNAVTKNIVSVDDAFESDSMDAILELMKKDLP